MLKNLGLRSLCVPLCFLLLATGCASRQLHTGPFLEVLFLSPEQVQQRLGKPDGIARNGDDGHLDYDSLGLSVYTWKQAVSSISQTKGRIMDSLGIGDTESQAATVLGGLEDDLKPGAKVGRIYIDHLAITVYIEQGKVVRAQIEHEGPDS